MKSSKKTAKKPKNNQPRSLGDRLKVAALALWLPVWVVLSFVVALLVASAVVEAGYRLGLIPFQVIDSSLFDAVFSALAFSLTIVIAIILPAQLKKVKISKVDLGLERLPSWKDMLLAPASLVVYLILSGILVSLVAALVPAFDAGQVQDVGFKDITKYYEYLLAFFTLIIVAPVAEEILFRGYLYGKLKKIVPMIPAMLLTSLTFAALHLQWNVAIDVFALSLVLLWMREVSGSIWAGVLLHMLKNSVAFYFLFINPTFFNTMGM